MVDPKNVTNYTRSDYELQEFMLFCISVAGKTASQIAIALQRFLDSNINPGELPFDMIYRLKRDGRLFDAIVASKLGQWNKLYWAFTEIAVFPAPDIRVAPVSDLEEVRGISFKTSRFFVVHSRPNVNYAVLDTHVLKWLGELGYDVPNHTPTGNKYLKLERCFLAEARKRNKSPANLDLEVWVSYARV